MKLNLHYRFCDFCHKAYLPKRKGQRFCRSKCRAAWHRSDAAFLARAAKPPPAEKFCPHCGKAI